MKTKLLSFFIFLLSFSCGNDTTLSANDYDRSCSNEDDCVAVLVGEMCKCYCEYGAIARSARNKYERDRDSIDCHTGCETTQYDCVACEDPPAIICQDNKCQFASGGD